MPQLNPAPWFMILLVSWTALLMLFSPKVTATQPQNLPSPYNLTPHKPAPWDWPWA